MLRKLKVMLTLSIHFTSFFDWMQFVSNCWHSFPGDSFESAQFYGAVYFLLLFLSLSSANNFPLFFFFFFVCLINNFENVSHTSTWFLCNGLSEFTVFFYNSLSFCFSLTCSSLCTVCLVDFEKYFRCHKEIKKNKNAQLYIRPFFKHCRA